MNSYDYQKTYDTAVNIPVEVTIGATITEIEGQQRQFEMLVQALANGLFDEPLSEAANNVPSGYYGRLKSIVEKNYDTLSRFEKILQRL